MASSTIDRALLRPEEAAEALGVGRAYLFSLIKSGDLRSVKVGRLRRIPRSAVDEFIALLEQESE